MNKILIIGLVIISLFLVGCSQTISEVTSDDEYVNEEVQISGTVKSPLKIGPISGFTLEDKNGDTIIVAASDLPQEGETTTVSGTLKKGALGIGFYIEVE